MRRMNNRDFQRTTPEGRWADGRLFWDGQVKFCAEYHLDNGCEERCPKGFSHRCEFCKGWHRTLNCPQKPRGWQPPPRDGGGKSYNSGKGAGKYGGKKGKNKGAGKASGYRSW